MNNRSIYKYMIIGAGPGGITAAAKLSENEIVWVDPEFKVGEFGTQFSEGNGIPGNTKVAAYNEVNEAIYKLIPATKPTLEETKSFAMTHFAPEKTCSLKIAAEPMQRISDKLTQHKNIHAIKGKVEEIVTTQSGSQVKINVAEGKSIEVFAKRVILATGAQPKQINLPAGLEKLVVIDSNTACNEKFAQSLRNQPNIKVAVRGSSHSAALAVMHLLQAGIPVKQFTNKDYRYAAPVKDANGKSYTIYDNTGLKGDVAEFSRDLIRDTAAGRGKYLGLWERVDYKADEFKDQLAGYTHLIDAIGYQTASTLIIDGKPQSEYQHNKTTMQILGKHGLFGLGIGYPQEKMQPYGEREALVGYTKFWQTVNDAEVTKVMRSKL